jgi:hypothetical protein
MKKQRKHYTPEEKVATLRRHLLEKVPISSASGKIYGRDLTATVTELKSQISSVRGLRQTEVENLDAALGA